MDTAINETHLSSKQHLWLRQLVGCFPPSDADFATADMGGAKLAELLVARIKETALDAEHRSDAALDGYRRVMAKVFDAMIARTITDNATQSLILKELLVRSQQSGGQDKLRDEGITEKAIIRLAQRIATETDDVGHAWLELQNAMDIAVKVQAEGVTKSNHGNFVDTVLARVAELAKEGDYAAAGEEIDEALEQADAQMARLLDSGVRVALLDGDTAKAAALLIRKTHMDAGGVASFEQLRGVFVLYYELGRDKGSNFDSALAIDLIRLVQSHATDRDQRGTALNGLGAALQILGARESSNARLEDAIDAYRNALQERSRVRVPLEWAMTLNNLGNAMQALGQRKSGTTMFEEAVSCYKSALLEYTRALVPLQWAATQNNLANALTALGKRNNDPTFLKAAITAYHDALEERTRDHAPLSWAMTQNNLGNTLRSIGEHEAGLHWLEQATNAYNSALVERTYEIALMGWAVTQFNLAGAHLALFQKFSNPADLETAHAAVMPAAVVFEDARANYQLDLAHTPLKKITRAKHPTY